MRTEPRPTRAEVSDAANAVDDGVDAIMLAGGNGGGQFPVRAELSALRPRAPIYAATGRADVARQLALAWGVVPLVCDLGTDVAQAITRISETLVLRSFIAPSSVIVVVSVSPDLAQGPSNFLKLQRV